MDAYLAFMRPRLGAARRVLRPHGSMLLHCDWRACHRLRVMLEEIFGAEGFVNHLIWSYGLGGSSPRRFARKHDDILFYAAGEEYYFRAPLVPATSLRMRGREKKSTDVLCVPSINNMAAERTGYPTQKPLALLRILVDACCPEDGTVIDPFCGSGTTLVAAQESGRHFIGIDASPDAVRLAARRLAEASSIFRPTTTAGPGPLLLRSHEKTATGSHVNGSGASPSLSSKQNHPRPGGTSPAERGRGTRSIGLP
jgi:DNA modification methylase